MADKKYQDRAECGFNKYVGKAYGIGYGPWRPTEKAITQADKKAARDAAETAAQAAAEAEVRAIIARGCPTTGERPCKVMHWTDEPNPLEGTYRALPQEREDAPGAARLIDVVILGFHIRVDGWHWYVKAYCEYQVQFECKQS
jgi:hypothetical protein